MKGVEARTALPSSVRTGTGPGGLTRLVVDGPDASAEVVLQGAHVTSWVPVGEDPVIWMSARSAYAPGVPLRGGVPVCFPWFGPHRVAGAPLHGFARTADWELRGAEERGGDVVLTLGLSDSEASRASAWPHRFDARLTITVGRRLVLALEVTNPGGEAITFTEAFHTYLAVADVRSATIGGLESSAYVDRLVSPDRHAPDGRPLTITGETDRIYVQPGTITVDDPAGLRVLQIGSGGAADAVVWNPWVAKSAAMGDFGDDEWIGMLCVEAGNVSAPVRLAPGESHTLTTAVEVSALV
ncbi:MAG TPA: D-hexose-6-phosphate mutarotase [Actinotalea sp.]